MTREEIISGLKFTVEMFLFDPSTGEYHTEPSNDMDKITIDACRGAIKLLEQEPILDKIRAEIEQRSYGIANDSVIQGKKYERSDILEIIDKYKAESEG